MFGENLIQIANIWLSCTEYVISALVDKLSTCEGSPRSKNISKCEKVKLEI